MTGRLDGKVAAVTGGDQGIGRANGSRTKARTSRYATARTNWVPTKSLPRCKGWDAG